MNTEQFIFSRRDSLKAAEEHISKIRVIAAQLMELSAEDLADLVQTLSNNKFYGLIEQHTTDQKKIKKLEDENRVLRDTLVESEKEKHLLKSSNTRQAFAGNALPRAGDDPEPWMQYDIPITVTDFMTDDPIIARKVIHMMVQTVNSKTSSGTWLISTHQDVAIIYRLITKENAFRNQPFCYVGDLKHFTDHYWPGVLRYAEPRDDIQALYLTPKQLSSALGKKGGPMERAPAYWGREYHELENARLNAGKRRMPNVSAYKQATDIKATITDLYMKIF